MAREKIFNHVVLVYRSSLITTQNYVDDKHYLDQRVEAKNAIAHVCKLTIYRALTLFMSAIAPRRLAVAFVNIETLKILNATSVKLN